MAMGVGLILLSSHVDAAAGRAKHKSLARLKAGLQSVRDSKDAAVERLEALRNREKILNSKSTNELVPASIPGMSRGFALVRDDIENMDGETAKSLHQELAHLIKRGFTKTLSLVVSANRGETGSLSESQILSGLKKFKSKEGFLKQLGKVEAANADPNPRSFEFSLAELKKIRHERDALNKKVQKCETDERMILAEIRVVSGAGDRDEEKPSRPFDLVRPVPGKIVSGFGMRMHPVDQIEKEHKGVDFAAKQGDSVKAAASGMVIFCGIQTGYGNVIILRHEDGLKTLYAHLSEFGVEVGDAVDRGSVIGKAGMTGNATGPHLHFEIRENDVAIDPQKYL